MRILIECTHAPYENLLALTGHDFVRIENPIAGWPAAAAFRPPAPNILTADSKDEAGPFDLVITQTLEQAIAWRKWTGPKVAVLFAAPRGPASAELSCLTGEYSFVFLDEGTRHQAGMDRTAAVIPLAVDTNEFKGYTGEVPAALTVCTLFRERGVAHGYDLHQWLTRDLPFRVAGENPGWPDGSLLDLDALKAAYRQYRLYLYTGTVPLTMAMLEAMATGSPVVTIRTAETARVISNGLNGFISSDRYELRRAVRRLLADPSLARGLGAAGRLAVKRLFSPADFVKRWNEVLERALSRR